jgi:hypothetical protein
MKLPMVTKTLGVVALVGAASASASVLVPLGSAAAMGPNTGSLVAPAETHSAVDAALNFKAQVDSTATFDGVSTWTYSYKVTSLAGGPGVGNRPLQGLTIPLDVAVGGVTVDQSTGVASGHLADFGTLNSGGSTIGFLWLSAPMVAGDSSQWVSFTSPLPPVLKVVGVQDGTVVNVPALVPVPEPATYAGLFALGLAGFAAFRRFRA